MKPVTQTKFGHGEGNCFVGALASILEVGIDEIPNVRADERWGEYIARLHDWLEHLGLAYIEVKKSGFGTALSSRWGYHLICGKGPRARPTGEAIYHAVVGYEGRAVHDPHPSRDGLLPDDETNPYSFGFLVRRFV